MLLNLILRILVIESVFKAEAIKLMSACNNDVDEKLCCNKQQITNMVENLSQ